MRTKALACAAALAACAFSAWAQNNVYSLNVVGYINVQLGANRFAFLATQLNPGSANYNISNVLSQTDVPDATTVLQFSGGTWSASTEAFIGGFGWFPGTMTLAPGQGFAIQSPAAYQLTFVGEVLQGGQTNSVPAGYSLIGAMTPQSLPLGDLTSDPTNTFIFPALDSDTYLPWDSTLGTIGGYGPAVQYIGGYGWFDGTANTNGPSPAVAASFFMLKGAAAQWGRVFNVY